MRDLLLLSYTFPPDNEAAARRPAQLHTYLADFGYRAIVVSSSNEGSRSNDPSIHRVPTGQENRATVFKSTLAGWFMRYGVPYNDRLGWVPFAEAQGANLIKSGQVRAIVSTSPFLAAHFVALSLKSRFNLPWIADFQDPVCENPTRTRAWPYPYDRLIERRFFRNADFLFANTDTVAALWTKCYPQYASKISILWNSFDPQEAVETSAPPSRSQKILAHVGALYGRRHPALLLEALERIGKDLPSVCVKFLGPIDPAILARYGSQFESLKARGLVDYNNQLVPRAEALQATADADYLLLLDVDAALQVPSKLVDYIRIGRPILACTATNSPVERILARSGISHTVIAPSDPPPLVDRKIVEFFRQPPGLRRPSAWFEETFNARMQAKAVAQILNKLIDRQ